MGDKMYRDSKRRIVPQILTENGYSVLSNGDMGGIDVGKYKLLVDKRGDVLPYQYFDVNQMKFVPGTLGGTFDGELPIATTTQPGIVQLENTLVGGSTTKAPTVAGVKQAVQQVDDKIMGIGYVAGNELATAIANTPDGGKLILSNGATYTVSSSITINKDIVIDGNNARIVATTGADKALIFEGDFEIFNTTFERIRVQINGVNIRAKIHHNKFINTQGSSIETWKDLKVLIVTDNEAEGVNLGLDSWRNFNNTGSFVYMNEEASKNMVGKIDYLRIERNRIKNLYGGTAIFLGGIYPDFIISDNIIDTMAQRAIGFWGGVGKGVVARNRIFKCGILKISNAEKKGPDGNPAGVGCNAIYSLYGDTGEVEVLDNYIEYVYENGIEGKYKCVKRNTVINTGMDLVNYPTPSYEGIFIMGNNAVVEDNTIINPKGNGIYKYDDAIGASNFSIRRNRIVSETFNTESGICFRTQTGQEYRNIFIEDNFIDNFSKAIEMPNQKKYYNVNIGHNTIINCTNKLNDFDGANIDIEGLGINRGNLIKNGNFNSWETNKFTDWTSNNGLLTISTNYAKNNARILATDAYNGRIIQTSVGIGNPGSYPNRYAQLVVRVKGNNKLLVRWYSLNFAGEQLEVWSFSDTIVDETGFKTIKMKLPYRQNFRLELCNSGPSGSWLEISEVYMYLID